MYIVVEGPDGCGKTSVAQALVAKFQGSQFVREPSGPIRKFLLEDQESVGLPHFAKALLFAASSYAHARTPGFLISDRWAPLSSRIYQTLDETASAERSSITAFWDSYVQNLKDSKVARAPDMLVYLKVDPHTAYHRAKERGGTDNMDAVDFFVTQQRVEAYNVMFSRKPYGIPTLVVDASQPVEVSATTIANSVLASADQETLRQLGGTRIEL